MGAVAEIVIYGLIAALSPVALLATFAVLSTRRARVNGLVFAIGFVLGQTLALAFAVVIGTISVRDGTGKVVSASFELGAGVLLVLLGLRHRRPAEPGRQLGGKRTSALLDRLSDLTPRRALAVGVVLGAGVKRVIVSLLAASTIALAGVSDEEELKLGGIYVGVACALVVLPVAVYVIAGPRADELVSDSKAWLTEHQHEVARIALLAFGALFVVDAIVSLA